MAPSTTIAAFAAVLALMPAGLLAFPTSFIREHSGTACFYTTGMFIAETKIMGNVPKVVADCSSNCCIKDAPAEYDAGKEYTLTVTNGVGHHMVGTSSGSIADANCKSAGKTYQGKDNAQTVKWTAPAAGTGGVEIGVTCGSGYSEPVFAFTATIKEAGATGPTTTLKRKATAAPVAPTTKAITAAPIATKAAGKEVSATTTPKAPTNATRATPATPAPNRVAVTYQVPTKSPTIRAKNSSASTIASLAVVVSAMVLGAVAMW